MLVLYFITVIIAVVIRFLVVPIAWVGSKSTALLIDVSSEFLSGYEGSTNWFSIITYMLVNLLIFILLFPLSILNGVVTGVFAYLNDIDSYIESLQEGDEK
jgi:hypothetical protein